MIDGILLKEFAMSTDSDVLERPRSDLERVIDCFQLQGAAQSLREISVKVSQMKIERAIADLREFGVSNSMLYSLILPRRTFDHRRQNQQPLSDDEAERAVILVNTIASAERIFGGQEKAERWLNQPNTQLAESVPIELLRSALGAREVEDELTRID